MPVGAIHRDDASAPFFDSTAKGELAVRRCPRCLHWWSPHVTACADCGMLDLDWEVTTGHARLVSWTVVHGRPSGDGPGPRTIVGLVELDDGPWLDAELVDVDETTLAEGLELVVGFHRPPDGESVPVFRPSQAAGS